MPTKISELIETLQGTKEKFGDIFVQVRDKKGNFRTLGGEPTPPGPNCTHTSLLLDPDHDRSRTASSNDHTV